MNVLINSVFASYLQDGAVSWLNIAFRLMQLPLGIFGVAVATVALPLVSRSAARGDMVAFRSGLAHALRLVMLLTIPSAIGLVILAKPIIALIYEHGRFSAFATEQTSGALQFYAIGLVGYASVKVLAPAFYALDRRNLPMLVSILSIGLNLFFNWLLTFRLGFGHRGLALSTSIIALINFSLLYLMMRRYAGALESGAMLRTFAKLLVAGACLAAVCFLGTHLFFSGTAKLTLGRELLSVGVTVITAGVVFFVTAYALRVAELQDLVQLIARKLKR